MSRKYKINLSYFTYNTLINDMNSFRFYKKDGTINKNLFLNTLIYNYHQIINKNIDEYSFKVNKLLENINLSTKQKSELIDKLIDLNKENENTGKNSYELTFVSTSKFETAFIDIEDNYLRQYNFSEYLRKLFNSYSKLHQDERERIIFSDKISLIEKAINTNKQITFIDSNENKVTYSPISILNSKDCQFAYVLLFSNENFYAFHLFKLIELRISKEQIENYKIDREKYEEIMKVDVQYIASAPIKTSVKFTKVGIKLYSSIYINRPTPYKIENDIYYFEAPFYQLFSFLIRFGKEAQVLNNDFLLDSLESFHRKAYFRIRDSRTKEKNS